MNKKMMQVITILIILLSIVLAVVFFGYLLSHRPSNVKTPYKPNSQVSGEKTNEVIPSKPSSDDKIEESGDISGDIIETLPIESSNENENVQDDKVTNNKVDEKAPIKEPTPQVVEEDKNSTIPNTIIEIGDNVVQDPVISSNTETSNQEKQQVLNELDSALQGLLEAVGKVPTVDEQKLDASLESEVQP